MLWVKLFKHMAHRNSRLQEDLSVTVRKQFIFVHVSCTSDNMHSCKVVFLKKSPKSSSLDKALQNCIRDVPSGAEVGEQVGLQEILAALLCISGIRECWRLLNHRVYGVVADS